MNSIMLTFGGETLLIEGKQWVGTIFVDATMSDASFSFSQGDVNGVEHAVNVDYSVFGFLADDLPQEAARELEKRAGRALTAWLDANERRVEKRFELSLQNA